MAQTETESTVLLQEIEHWDSQTKSWECSRKGQEKHKYHNVRVQLIAAITRYGLQLRVKYRGNLKKWQLTYGLSLLVKKPLQQSATTTEFYTQN